MIVRGQTGQGTSPKSVGTAVEGMELKMIFGSLRKNGRVEKMGKRGTFILVAFFVWLPGMVQSQPAAPEPRTRPGVYGGRTLSQVTIGPFVVEDLEMVPDPAKLGHEIRFKVRLKNGGIPVRANIRIQERDEIVTMIDHVRMDFGINEYSFPDTGYSLQRIYQCFTVVVEVEGKPHNAETARDLCARPLGWTLRP